MQDLSKICDSRHDLADLHSLCLHLPAAYNYNGNNRQIEYYHKKRLEDSHKGLDTEV